MASQSHKTREQLEIPGCNRSLNQGEVYKNHENKIG